MLRDTADRTLGVLSCHFRLRKVIQRGEVWSGRRKIAYYMAVGLVWFTELCPDLRQLTGWS